MIKLACASFFSFYMPVVTATKRQSNISQDVLPALLDTLIPADELTPSASALGVPEKILANYAGHATYLRLIEYGCRWLNQTAEKKFNMQFVELEAAEQQQLVQQLAAKKPSTILYQFFLLLRNRSLELYYSQNQSWYGLTLSQTPQPLGYQNYHEAPDI